MFDLDDTLYPERQFAQSGFRAAAAWARSTIASDDAAGSLDGIEHDMLAALDSGKLGGLFADVLAARLGADEAARHLDGFLAAYRDHSPEIALFADAADLLTGLGAFDGGAPPAIGLITDGTVAVQTAKVAALGLERAFSRIVYTHGLGGRAYAKPHPASFEAMEQALGGPGVQLVYIGDNPSKDFVSPNARGWISVQVHRPEAESNGHRRIHAGAAAVPGGEPRHRIASLAELRGVLGL